jgi:hypothetical protein
MHAGAGKSPAGTNRQGRGRYSLSCLPFMLAEGCFGLQDLVFRNLGKNPVLVGGDDDSKVPDRKGRRKCRSGRQPKTGGFTRERLRHLGPRTVRRLWKPVRGGDPAQLHLRPRADRAGRLRDAAAQEPAAGHQAAGIPAPLVTPPVFSLFGQGVPDSGVGSTRSPRSPETSGERRFMKLVKSSCEVGCPAWWSAHARMRPRTIDERIASNRTVEPCNRCSPALR